MVRVQRLHKTAPGDLIVLGKYGDEYIDAEGYEYVIDPALQEKHPKAGTVLFIHDSFGESFKPLLEEVFANVVTLHHLKLGNNLESLLEQHKPQVVIYETVERDFPL